MIIDCVGCLHGYFPEMKGGDLLIITGDLTRTGRRQEYIDKFIPWLFNQQIGNYKKVVWIAGNHDSWIEKNISVKNQLAFGEYLCDSGTTYQGLKIWGSPRTSRFEGINPKTTAFTVENDSAIETYFDLIPDDVDILITHGPPFTIRDITTDGLQVGSPYLLAKHIQHLRPKLWVFSHIHEAYGQEGPYSWNNTRYVNCSLMNERYQPVNAPIRIILDDADLPDGT